MSGHQRLPANIEHEIRIISVEIWKDSGWRKIYTLVRTSTNVTRVSMAVNMNVGL